MGRLIDLTGQRFGRLTVLGRDLSKTGDAVFWNCKCDCGSIKSIVGSNLRYGHTQSCGCLREATQASNFLSRDHTKKDNPRLYSIWKSMQQRCYNTNHKAYQNYGGRGIQICDEWIGDSGFKNFVEWATDNGYCESLTIDRIDVNGNYSPQNCRWITHRENQNNTRHNRYIAYNGETKTLAQWAEIYGLRQCELKRRLDYLNLPIDIALTMKSNPKTVFNGRMLCIKNLAQRYGINYTTFILGIFRDGKSADDIIREQHTLQQR